WCCRRCKREVLVAYQWRSEKTGNALLQALGKSFHVQEVPPQECHPDYSCRTAPNLSLYKAVRKASKCCRASYHGI
ncbi:unnamed protein product, partial [Discosporangium mesarthrocarpum]